MEITYRDFEREVLKSDLPVLVEFWGSWCPPCQREKEVLERLEEKYKGTVKIRTINVDRNPIIGLKYHIKGVPAYIIFYQGKIICKDIAAKSERQLVEMIEEALRKIKG